MRKRNSPSPFGVSNRKVHGRKRKSSTSGGLLKGLRLGGVSCFLVIIVMLGTAAFLTLSAANRTAGVAWGSLSDARSGGEFILPSSGFIVVEMANVLLDEEGHEIDYDANSILSLRGTKGEPGLLPLSDSRGSLFSEAESASTPGTRNASESVPMNFSWTLSERFADSRSTGVFSDSGTPAAGGVQFKFPDRLVERSGQSGNGLFSNFGVSRMSEFRTQFSGQFSVGESAFSTANGALFADSAVSRLSSFKAALGDSGSGGDESESTASDFEAVVLSAVEDGRKLVIEDGETDAEEEDVVLAEVGVHWKEHVVKAGETLSDIAVAHGIAMSDIVKANELKNPNRLSEKQLLLIPNESASVEATLEEVLTRKARLVAARERVIPIKVTAYVVAEGDSLWSIANSQNLEIDTLFGSNDMKNPNMIRPGATLRIPNQDGIFYKVASGDTLAGIAQKYGITADRIKSANGDGVEPLIAGKEIFLPGARPEATVASSSSSRSSSRSGSSSTVSSSSRNYRWPVVGNISSAFGWRRHPITRRRDFHTGIDIRAPRGRPIQAAQGGTVDYAGWMGGYGRVVVINHGNGYSTLYAHCHSLSVRKGQRVRQGQTIATVGSTGRTTGPHLHFEVRRGNNPVNPLGLLR